MSSVWAWVTVAWLGVTAGGGGALAGSPPIITTQPTNQMVATGGTITLSPTVTGDTPLSYQWLKDGRMLAGATNSTLTLTNAAVTDSGAYVVAVQNAYGLALSEPALVAAGNPSLLAWGYNFGGQLGDGTWNSRSLPEPVATNVVTAAAGHGYSFF